MTRQPPGSEQHDVEPQIAAGTVGPARDEYGRTNESPALMRAQRFESLREVRPCLDLDNGNDPTAPGQNIDLARRRTQPVGQQAIAAQPQVPRTNRFGKPPEPFGPPSGRTAHRVGPPPAPSPASCMALV